MKLNLSKSKQPRTGKKYLLYARVSPKGSTWDAGETSVSVQLQECREYVLRRDPSAEFVEIVDELKSGKNLDRPGIQQIIAELDSGRPDWDCLVAWHLDRLTRSLTDALPLFKKIRDADRGFMSVRQEIDMFTAGGRFMLHIFISTAEYEREMTSERVTAKMHGIAAQGKIPWGNIPMGYRRKKGAKNTLEIEPEGAEVVRNIFSLYLDGKMTFKEIHARYKNHIKYRQHIYQILRNPLYIGELHYAGNVYKAEHEPIIEREIFDQVQMLLPSGNYNKARPGAQKYKYLLSGLVQCHCGRHMTCSSANKKGEKYFYYKCTNPNCNNAINAERLDEALLEQIRVMATDPKFIQSVYEEYLQDIEERRRAAEPRFAQLESELAEAAKKEQNIADMFLSGIVNQSNMDYWNRQLESIRQEREQLELQKKSLFKDVDQDQTCTFPQLLESITDWAKALNLAKEDFALKKNLILSLVNQVKCTGKGEFDIELVMSKCIKWWATRALIITIHLILEIGRKYR